MSGLTPVKSLPLSEVVETRLREYIRDAGYVEGDALPGELELAENLGVSRNVVREALSRFRMLGLVRSRKRRGMVMGRPDIPGALSRIFDAAFLDDSRVRELRELRLMIELGQAPFIFARCTEEDVRELEEIVEQEMAVAADRDASRALDVRFHSRLYRIGGSEILQAFESLLPSFFDHADHSAFNPKRFTDKKTITHQILAGELKNGTAGTFSAAMRAHLLPHIERLANAPLERSS